MRKRIAKKHNDRGQTIMSLKRRRRLFCRALDRALCEGIPRWDAGPEHIRDMMIDATLMGLEAHYDVGEISAVFTYSWEDENGNKRRICIDIRPDNAQHGEG